VKNIKYFENVSVFTETSGLKPQNQRSVICEISSVSILRRIMSIYCTLFAQN